MIPTSETPVGQLVATSPRLARFFERLGIDYCCRGTTPLGQACRERGLEVAAVLRQLGFDEDDAPDHGFDGASALMVELIAHIVAAHHGYLRRELPRLEALADRVVAAHGARHPELHELREVLASLKEELMLHMIKEEKVLFPIITRLEAATEMPQFHSSSIVVPIQVMQHEHDEAGAALARLRALTEGYTPPEDACPTFRAMLEGLAELEADLHLHIHEENNILFPRARATEAALSRTRDES
jgi:regulator of cell morphogenesis and NO signaling